MKFFVTIMNYEQDIREQLRDETSRLIVAVPVPLNPWVEKGTTWVLPEEDIGPRSCCQTYYHMYVLPSSFITF
jgi:hypothetical protein